MRGDKCSDTPRRPVQCTDRFITNYVTQCTERSQIGVAVMFRTFRSGLPFAAVLFLSASPAWAEIQVTKLTDVLAQSETIAIVRLLDLPGAGAPRKPRLNVLRVLKGHFGTGEQEVNFSEYEYPDRQPGEFVAFLDNDRKWRFTAAPVWGKNVDSDLLLVYGFTYRDSHLVSPGLLSLAQLTAYLKTGRLDYSFSGPVWFPQHGKINWAPSDLRIEGTYDAVKNTAHVTGLGQLVGLPSEPSVNMALRANQPSLRLTYSGRGNRQLEIRGGVEGLQRTGGLVARFAVTVPGVLTEATLKKYLADPRLGRCSYKFRLRCLATKDYPKLDLSLTLHGDFDDRLEGWGGGPLEIDSAGPRETTESHWVLRVETMAREGRSVVLDFNLLTPTKAKDAHWWKMLGGWGLQSELLYGLNSAPVRGTLSLNDGKTLRAITSFSVDVDPVAFGCAYGK